MLGLSNFGAANSRGMGLTGSQAVPVSKQTQVTGLFLQQNTRVILHTIITSSQNLLVFKLYLHIFVTITSSFGEAKLKQGLTLAEMIKIWIMTALEYLCFLPYCYLD